MGKDRPAVVLQRHQILQGVDTGMETGGDQAGEYTGDIGAVLILVEQGVLTLPNEQLERPLCQVIVCAL
jgi:hypothetical protein